MKRVIAILPLIFVACLGVFGDQAQTNAIKNRADHPSNGTRMWISSFAIGNSPIAVSTQPCEWPVPNGAKATPEIPLDISRQWRTNYAVFRQLLISAAEQAHLDSSSLAKALAPDVQNPEAMPILPVEAHSAEVSGELAWVVTYRWGNVGFGTSTEPLTHIMVRAFAQKTLKVIWGKQCD